jgi:uncharacterized protein involved in response to NO
MRTLAPSSTNAPSAIASRAGGALGPLAALSAKGFRPFFLGAAAFAAAILPIWLLALLGIVDPSGHLDATSWHAHEMVFGFAVAVLAGFLLTAVTNWTKRETLVGWPLLGLAALWLLGRVVVSAGPVVPGWLVATVDLAFLPALIVVLARPLLAAKSRRNFVMLAVLAALFVANVAIHLDALGVLPGWRHRANGFAVDVVVLVIIVMAGRVFPMFTRNATGVRSIRSIPRLDVVAIAGMALLAVLDFAAPASPLRPWVAVLAGAAAAARAVHWGARHSFRAPLLWVLHVGYAWIVLGLVLRGVSTLESLSNVAVSSMAMHALTVGGIGTVTLGMMSRVTLGHTGRLLEVSPAVHVAFLAMTAAAIVRVLAPLAPGASYHALLVVAGSAWTVAFAIFLASFGRMLVTPRVDGAPGCDPLATLGRAR